MALRILGGRYATSGDADHPVMVGEERGELIEYMGGRMDPPEQKHGLSSGAPLADVKPNPGGDRNVPPCRCGTPLLCDDHTPADGLAHQHAHGQPEPHAA